MADTSTATTNFNKTVVDYISKSLIANLRGGLPHIPLEATVLASHVVGTNGLYRFVAVADVAAALTALVEDTPQTAAGATELAIDYNEFTAARYYAKVGLTDEANRNSPHSLFQVAVERVTRNALASIDLFARDNVWEAAATLSAETVMRGGGKATRVLTGTADILTGAMLIRAAATLAGRNVLRIGATLDPIRGQTGGRYAAILHPNQVADIMLDTATGGYTEVAKYADPVALLTGEVGSYRGIAIVSSSNAKVYATGGVGGIPIYKAQVYGQQALAFADLGDLQVEVYPPGPGNGERSDLFGQVGIAAWAARIGGVYITKAGDAAGHAIALETAAST